MVTSGSIGGVMVNTLAQNARGVGSIHTLGTIFPIFITLIIIYICNIYNKPCESFLFLEWSGNLHKNIKTDVGKDY